MSEDQRLDGDRFSDEQGGRVVIGDVKGGIHDQWTADTFAF